MCVPAVSSLYDDTDVPLDEKAIEKVLRMGDPKGRAVLAAEFAQILETLEPFEPEAINGAIKAFCEDRKYGYGQGRASRCVSRCAAQR